MTPIQAVDEIVVAAPPARAWKLLADIAGMPGWWPSNPRLRVLRVEPGIIGSEVEIKPFGGKPFRSRVVSVEEPSRIRMEYFGGFISGRGERRLEPAGSGTRIRYELDVHAAGRLVARIARIIPLGPLHSKPMQAVLRNLRNALR